MLKPYRIIREAARAIEDSAMEAIDALKEGRIEQEPQITDRMLGHIEEKMKGYKTKGITWQAKTFTDRGHNAQEKRYGADFMGIAIIKLKHFEVNKGFLAQAKLIDPEEGISQSEYKRMRDQCKQMLDHTPDSFVFLYSPKGINIVPAITIASCDHTINPHNFYSRSMSRFYEEHFSCFIGDGRLKAPQIDCLEEIASDFQAKRVLALSAESDS